MATRVIPTFLLKGLDPNRLLIDYQSGFFSRQPTNKSKIKITNNTTILAPTYGTTNQSPIYCVKDRNNCNIIIATTGHQDYEVFTRTGGTLPTGGRCDNCKEDFTHKAIGYPIAYKEVIALTNDDPNPKNAQYRILYSFWTEGIYCDFECALKSVRDILSKPSDHRNGSLNDSESKLKLLYRLTYPNAGPLRPAQDHRLLRSNGGSLTREQWKDDRHIFIRTDRVLIIPVKVEYIQQNFLNTATIINYNQDTTTVIAST